MTVEATSDPSWIIVFDLEGDNLDVEAGVSAGTPVLWVEASTDKFVFNRQQIEALIAHLQSWVETGSLEITK